MLKATKNAATRVFAGSIVGWIPHRMKRNWMMPVHARVTKEICTTPDR